jgi:ankyrin repeat protein
LSNGTATGAQIREGYCFASTYGRVHVVEFLLDRDLDVDTELTIHGAGHTALHVASFHARLDVVALLIQRGASVHVKDKTWGTPPLIWALTGWGMVKSAADAERYYDVVARLVDAGSNVRSDLLEWDKARADPRMMAALTRRRTAD